SGIPALHRRIEQDLQTAIRRARKESDCPSRERVFRLWIGGRELRRGRVSKALVQFRHDVEISRESAQLRGRAQNELGARIDVEGLVEALGVDAKVVPGGAALVEQHG